MKRVVLNLKEMRARASDAPVIVDFDGKEHAVTGLPVDGYLAIIGVQDRFNALSGPDGQDARSLEGLVDLINEVKSLITAAVPGFPVGGLLLEELMIVVQAIQGAVIGGESSESDGGAGGDAGPGESTSPS